MPVTEDLFAGIRANGHSLAPLELLVPNNAFVRVLLLQCRGKLEATPQRIGNVDGGEAFDKHSAFLKLVHESSPAPSLALTPEYSTPWETIEWAIGNGVFPAVGSLWILGCESITPDALKALIGKHGGVNWWSELEALDLNGRTFVDPILMIFRASEGAGPNSVHIAIQFKSREMGGDEGKLERDHLILGSKLYILSNAPAPSISLVPIVCSDALDLDHTLLPQFLYQPYTFVHLQCTPNTFRAMLKSYRERVYTRNEGNRYSFINLNWARGTEVPDVSTEWTFGGSCYYQRPEKVTEPRQADEFVDRNHSRGVYLKFCKETKSAPFYFSCSEHVFDFRCTKTDQQLSEAGKDRAGIQDAHTYSWKSDAKVWEEKDFVDDGLVEVLRAKASPSLTPILELASSRERLIAFSTGNVEFHPNWHVPHYARSFQVASGTEMPSGTLVILRHEQQEHVDRTIQQFLALEQEIVPKPESYVGVFRDLATQGGISLGMRPDSTGEYKSNLVVGETSCNGAMMFLGDASESRARQTLDKLEGELKPNRAAVWFREGGTVRNLSSAPREITSSQGDRRDISEVA